MKITEESPLRLVLEQKSYFSYVVVSIFPIIGIYLLATQFHEIKSVVIELAFVTVGGAGILFNTSYKLLLDKTTRKAMIFRIRLAGSKTETIDFGQLKEASIEEYIQTNTSGSGPRVQRNYNLVLYSHDGQGYSLPINGSTNFTIAGMSLNGFAARNTIINLGNKIAAFIGVPFVDRRPPTATEVVSGIASAIQNSSPHTPPIVPVQPSPPIQPIQSTQPIQPTETHLETAPKS